MRAFAGVVLGLAWLTGLSAQTQTQFRYLSYVDAVPVFATLNEPAPPASEWSSWVAAADAATRERVALGDEASIVNLLLFGSSFTSHPRMTSAQLTPQNVQQAMRARIDDFEQALAQPVKNERLQFARRFVPIGTAVRPRLMAMIDRVMQEAETLARLTKQAEALGDPSLEFAERSRLYRDRGLASDTSVRVNFAVEEALRSLIPVLARPVQRVAVIGPGLDFVDKEAGYDFYPPQTLQPFAIIDSLVRLGLALGDRVEVATFDVSARVNDHIAQIARRAREGSAYVLHVPLDGAVAWTPPLLDYFSRFGDTIGSPVPVTIPPGIGPLKLRAVSVRPGVVGRIAAHDINITAQMLTLRDAERFDLIIGTNIFLYYDRLQQGLAMVNIAGMLRPGGILLSNNALVEVPAAGMRSIGYSKTVYSNRSEDGDLVIWYQKGIK